MFVVYINKDLIFEGSFCLSLRYPEYLADILVGTYIGAISERRYINKPLYIHTLLTGGVGNRK